MDKNDKLFGLGLAAIVGVATCIPIVYACSKGHDPFEKVDIIKYTGIQAAGIVGAYLIGSGQIDGFVKCANATKPFLGCRVQKPVKRIC